MLCFLLGGCKLAVIVVEGGEVQSGASGTCLAGNVCIHDVVDTGYTETFTAEADPGWHFVRWHGGSGFFCQDSNEDSCSLSTIGLDGIPFIEAFLSSSTTFYLMPVFSPTPLADTVTVNGLQWYQPAIFTGLSWNAINAVCPGGICGAGASLKGRDLGGWTWAGVDEVNALFNAYIYAVTGIQDALGPGEGDWQYFLTEVSEAFWSDGWAVTDTDGRIFTSGFSAGFVEGFPDAGACSHSIGKVDEGVGGAPSYFDVAAAWCDADPAYAYPNVGAWFYRAAP